MCSCRNLHIFGSPKNTSHEVLKPPRAVSKSQTGCAFTQTPKIVGVSLWPPSKPNKQKGRRLKKGDGHRVLSSPALRGRQPRPLAPTIPDPELGVGAGSGTGGSGEDWFWSGVVFGCFWGEDWFGVVIFFFLMFLVLEMVSQTA